MIRGAFKIITFSITILIVILFSASLSAAHIPAEKSPIIASLGMSLPFTWLAMILAIIFWLCFKKIKLTIALLAYILLSLPIWNDTILIPTNRYNLTNANEVKIMSFNAKMFNFYKGYDDIIKLIEREDPDILCIQEFGHYSNICTKRHNKTNVLKKFNSLFPYSHRWYKNQNSRSENGLATFSKYRIIKKEKVMYHSKNNVSILSDIVIHTDTLRIINNHLESNKLSSKQRDVAIEMINDGITRDAIIASTKNLSQTLGKAGNIRTKQAQKIREYLDKSPHPAIVCGDFNDVPQSYVFNKIKGSNLQSAFEAAGPFGYYYTYHENLMLFPIDHILIDKQYKIKKAEVIKEKISDHYPIVVTFYSK